MRRYINPTVNVIMAVVIASELRNVGSSLAIGFGAMVVLTLIDIAKDVEAIKERGQ